MYVICPTCGCAFEVTTGAKNRADKGGYRQFCSRVCGAKGRRKNKTPEQKTAEKAEYDRERRRRLAGKIKAEKAEYFRRTYDPEKAAIHRKSRAPYHAEYCRRPEYVEWKREYDKVYRAKKEHGEFWEAAILALEIRRTCLELQDDTEIRRQSGTLNKKQQRRNHYVRTHSNQSEIGALGNPSSDQGGQHAARRG